MLVAASLLSRVPRLDRAGGCVCCPPGLETGVRRKVLGGSFAHLATGLKIHRSLAWHLWQREHDCVECSRWLAHTPVTSTPPAPAHTPEPARTQEERVDFSCPSGVALHRPASSVFFISIFFPPHF